MAEGFSRWQKVVVVSGFVGFIVTGIYGLRYSLILELLFIFSLLCFLLPFFFVMCKDWPSFQLKKRRRGDGRWMRRDIRVRIANTTSQ